MTLLICGLNWASYYWLWDQNYDMDILVEQWAPQCLMLVFLTSSWLKSALESKILAFLGKISFMLYLIHPIFIEGFMT